MEEKIAAWEWLDRAVEEIKFRPDRKAVREELEAHLEDAAAEQLRLYPEITQEEAEARALARMGDPAELGRALAEVHKPLLGYLWRVSQVLLRITLAFVLLYFLSPYNWADRNGIWGIKRKGEQYTSLSGKSVQLGDYTFRVTEAKFLQLDSPIIYDHLTIDFRVYFPKFWEPVSWEGVCDALTVVDPLGERRGRNYMQTDSEGRTSRTATVFHAGWGLFHRDFRVSISSILGEELRKGDQASLEFQFEQGNFTIEVPLTDCVVKQR